MRILKKGLSMYVFTGCKIFAIALLQPLFCFYCGENRLEKKYLIVRYGSIVIIIVGQKYIKALLFF